jgi:peptidoglycan hydrolase CwlO-like protein
MQDASVGTVQNLCDVMNDMNKDLKQLNKNAKEALDSIVRTAGKGPTEEDLKEQEREEKRQNKKQEAKQAKKEAKRTKKAEEAQKKDVEAKEREAAEKKVTQEKAMAKKPSYKVAAAANPFARSNSDVNSPRSK